MEARERTQPAIAADAVEYVSVEALFLDESNPRLAAGRDAGDQVTQIELIKRLWQREATEEIALSIAENGFYPQEPLIVVPGDEAGTWTVVEGNRRLAAVLLLLNDSHRRAARATDLPRISLERRSGLQKLPVIRYATRSDVWAYLGFRHIHGTKPWDAFSKARYVADVHETFKIPLDEIARRIGDKNVTVVRLYRGLKVLEQAERDTSFNRDDRFRRRFSFSHLYTALDYKEFQHFLGITESSWRRANPVPPSHSDALRLVMLWLYGQASTNTPPLIQTQAKDLSRLRDALSTSRGVSLLRAGRSLDSAYEASLGNERRFRDALEQAQEELRRAKGTVVGGFRGEKELLATIDITLELAGSLRDEMRSMAAVSGQDKGSTNR